MKPEYQNGKLTLYLGDCLEVLRSLPAESVNCCVTSPPYWGLRDYGHDGQIGLERTPTEFVSKMVEVFREVRRVLESDGTLWLNLGDTYNAYNGGAGPGSKLSKTQTEQRPRLESVYGLQDKTLKPKDLIGIPWRVALALQDDGWWLRQDIIWHKPNPMPESVRDRCTKAHEYIFLLAKSERYYLDANGLQERAVCGANGSQFHTGKTGQQLGRSQVRERTTKYDLDDDQHLGHVYETRNKRSVWSVPTKSYKGAHFATFPAELIEPCVVAGCPEGGVVLDPFLGSGTTGEVAARNGCGFIGCELNPEYLELAKARLAQGVLF